MDSCETLQNSISVVCMIIHWESWPKGGMVWTIHKVWKIARLESLCSK